MGTMDMAFNGSETLYIASDGYSGLITGDFGGLGVVLDGTGLVYMNTENRILTFEGTNWDDLGLNQTEEGGKVTTAILLAWRFATLISQPIHQQAVSEWHQISPSMSQAVYPRKKSWMMIFHHM